MKKKLLLLLLLSTAGAFPQVGVIDASFGTNGKVATPMGSGNSYANAVTVQPDGKLLVGGTYLSSHGEFDFALARYNPDGSLDTTFGIAGKVVTSFLDNGHNYSYIHSIHLQADGKFIVVGSTGLASSFVNLGIVRYNANGSIDAGFGTNGKIVRNLWANSLPGNKLVFLPDGSFIVTSAKLYVETQNYDIGVEKYTANGVIDASFGTNGQVIASYGNTLNTARSTPSAIALKADGKFVIAGNYFQGNISKMAVAQFNANGTLDTSFNGNGKVLTTFVGSAYSEGFEVFTSADGKITVAGSVYTNTSRSFGLVRYSANGVLDTAFDTDGMAQSVFAEGDDYSFINGICHLENGKYLVVSKPGYFVLQSSDFVIRRYNANASVDTAFGTNGKASVTFDTGENQAVQAAVTPAGDIVVAGKSVPLSDDFNTETNDFALTKFSANGTLDASFGSNGKVTATFEKGNDELAALLTLPDDKLIAVGSSAYRQGNNTSRRHIVIAKYNANGSLDATFGTGGKVYSVFGDNFNMPAAAVLQPDGKILVCNMYNVYGQNFNSFEIIRYNANGSLDTGFGTAGKAGINFNGAVILVQPDGKILVAGDSYLGNSTSAVNVVRFNANGSLDTAFGTNGQASVSFPGASFTFASALLQPDGKIFVCQSVASSSTVMILMGMRFKTDGSLDAGFGSNGMLTALSSTNGEAFLSQKAFLQPDGKILVTGRNTGSFTSFATARINTNGTLDIAYGTGGVVSAPLSEYRELKDVALQADGKFLVALSKYNQPADTYDFVIRRFNPDGTFDAVFSEQQGIATSFYNGYDEASAIALQSDHKIVLAGSTHNGISKDFALVRLGNDVLGVNQPESAANDVFIYPNPAKNMVYIQAGAGVEVVSYAVFNMLGQAVSKGSGSEPHINITNLGSGVYTLQVATNKGTISRKFIKE